MGRLVVFSGAGISAESGIPTFRGDGGLWNGHKIGVVCDYNTWKANFQAVHGFYNELRVALGAAQPNAAHLKVAEWSRRYETTNLTQNVDDLFERAGCSSVVHVHGFLRNMQCMACGHVWDIGYAEWTPGDSCPNQPRCLCRKGIKPGVVLFNENAPRYADMYRTLNALTDDDVVVVIGTSGQVVSIGGLLEGRPGYKVLNNLTEAASMYDRAIEQSVYHETFFEPATGAAEKIDAILRERLG